MCSITGCISRNNNPIDLNLLKSIIIKAEDRGRDSFGIVYLGKDYYKEQKFIGKPSETDFEMFNDNNVTVIMNNNRAEPTTEYVEHKTLLDVQPFSYETTFVAHNGTIANDKELEKKYDLKRNTKIDTAIVPALLNKIWDGKDENKLIEILNTEIIGSYAMSIWDKRNPDTLWLAVNYKPMYLLYDMKNDIIYYTSLESYLMVDDLNEYFNSNFKIHEVKPYTLLKISKDNIESFCLYKKKEGKEKALIVCSSGLDSTVSAAWAKKEGYDISLLHFKYGCRAQKAEEKAIKEISEFFNCDLITIPIDIFKNVIKNSRLTNPEECGELTKEETSVELAWEWVPARNLIFLSIAAGYAEAMKFDYIVLGGNLEESGCILNDKLNVVRMFDGTKKMPIDVNVGDELMGWDEKNNKLDKTVVTDKFQPKFNSYLKITCEGRKFKNRKSEKVEFTVSEEHPFYVKKVGWVKAKDLVEENILMRYQDIKQSEIQSNKETNNGTFWKNDMTGKNNYMAGHIRTGGVCWCGNPHPNNKEQIKATMIEKAKDPEFIKSISDGVKKYLENITLEQKEMFRNNTRNGILKAMDRFFKETGYKHWNSTPQRRKEISEMVIDLIDKGIINPANLTKRPTLIESKFITFFEKYNLPFVYKGDGQIWITSKGKHLNPDFVNLETKKIIEVTTKDFPFHTQKEMDNRKFLFENVGWDMLYLTDKDLENEEITVNLIKQFMGGLKNGFRITKIEKIEEEVQTYNYHCEPHNNFFIGNSGVLVHNSYPDNELIFQKKFNDILPNALNLQNRVRLLTPVANLMKHEIIKLGVECGAPLHLTWSCYEDGDKPCGTCGPDFMRRVGFKMNGIKDMQEYKVEKENFWNNCKNIILTNGKWEEQK